jgi:hypothetical protein
MKKGLYEDKWVTNIHCFYSILWSSVLCHYSTASLRFLPQNCVGNWSLLTHRTLAGRDGNYTEENIHVYDNDSHKLKINYQDIFIPVASATILCNYFFCLLWSSGLWLHVVYVVIIIFEEHMASIFLTEIKTLTWKVEVIYSSKTLETTYKTTQCHNP